MTRLDELISELEHVRKRRFFNNMVDCWSGEEFKLDRMLFEQEQDLKKEIEKEKEKMKNE